MGIGLIGFEIGGAKFGCGEHLSVTLKIVMNEHLEICFAFKSFMAIALAWGPPQICVT